MRVIVPVTDWKEHYEQAAWLVQIKPNKQNGLSKISAADAFQLRSLSVERFIHRIGILDSESFKEILEAIMIVLGIKLTE